MPPLIPPTYIQPLLGLPVTLRSAGYKFHCMLENMILSILCTQSFDKKNLLYKSLHVRHIQSVLMKVCILCNIYIEYIQYLG